MKKYLFLIILSVLFFTGLDVNAQSINIVSYGINYYRYNTSATSSATTGTFNFATTGTLPIYPISGYKNNYYAWAWYGIDFLSDSPVNGSAIGYKITSTFKIAMDGLVNNIGSTGFTGFVHFNNGTIKDEVSTVEVIGLEDGAGTFKITSVVTLTSETELSGLTYSLRANSSIGSAPYGNTIYTQLSLLDTEVELTNDLNSAILNSINSNQQITNDKLNQIDKNQQATNDKLDQTNDKLDNIDSVLNNSDVDDETGKSFFDSFKSSDNGGISGIITAPLNAINAMLNGSCTPLQATFKGKDISLQCGTDMWNKLGGIKEFLNLVLGGLLCYRICLKIFNIVQNLKNPDNDKVEVMDL